MRVDRDIGTAGLPDREQCDHHLGRALKADGNKGVGGDTTSRQRTTQLVGACVELSIRHLPATPLHGDTVRMLIDLRLKEVGSRRGLGSGPASGRPGFECGNVGVRQHPKITDQTVRRVGHVVKHREETADHAPNCGWLKQVCVVFQRGTDAAGHIPVVHKHRQIKLGSRDSNADGFDRQPWQLHRRHQV